MKGGWFVFRVTVFIFLACVRVVGASDAPSSFPGPPPESRQMLLVIADGWESPLGVLQRYEREGPGRKWIAVGDPVPVTLGRNGLGQGRGLVALSGSDGPVKREGDGRSPAGVFRLGPAFGTLSDREVQGLRVPYHGIGAETSCVEDTGSRYYNSIIERGEVEERDWREVDPMLRPDNLYRLGILVRHNMDPVVPGAGSCIFFHIRSGPGMPTSGCTAFEEEDLRRILFWLDEAATPVLVQWPRNEIGRFPNP